MKKKTMVLLLAGMLCLTAIGCGGQTDNSQDAVESTDTEVQQPETDGEQEEASAGEDVTIEFLYYADDTQKAIIESACAAYEDSHPGLR